MRTTSLTSTLSTPSPALQLIAHSAKLRMVLAMAICFVCGYSSLLAQTDYATPYAFTTLAGSHGNSGVTNGTGSAALFSDPRGVALDGSGNIYVADPFNIRKITPGGVVTTFAGPIPPFTTNPAGYADGTGSAAQFDQTYGVAIDHAGNLYVSDGAADTIRKITPGAVVSTLAGSFTNQGSSDGTGSAASFYSPAGLTVDGGGNIYVADSQNSTIRKITPGGLVTTLAGSAGHTGSTDGSGSAARFFYPNDVTLDGSGNLLVADTGNNTIRKVTPSGVVTTVTGQPGVSGPYGGVTDGSLSNALFNQPLGVAVDSRGNIYVAEPYVIRQITPGGIVTTLAGNTQNSAAADGTGSTAIFNKPWSLAVDGSGNIYVADQNDYTIRKGSLVGDAFGGTIAGVNLNYSSWFSYYTTASYPLIYEYYLGYQYVYPAGSGVNLYDYGSGHFWYTQASYFPFIYDYSLGAFLYYYQANTPHRHFYDFATSQVITE